MKRPEVLEGETIKVGTKCGNMYITINRDADKKVAEIIMRLGKPGSCAAAWLQVFGKLVTHHIKNNHSLARIVKQFEGVDCVGVKEGVSCPDGIATAFRKVMEAE